VQREAELDEALRRAVTDFDIEAASLEEPSTRRVFANGLELCCLDWGGGGEPVVFLHGGNQTAHAWDLVCLQLRGRYRCISVDLRGHGKSAFPEDGRWQMRVQAEDVLARHSGPTYRAPPSSSTERRRGPTPTRRSCSS
jgi:alpha-beta hydrolase superfamily lysophospholipase